MVGKVVLGSFVGTGSGFAAGGSILGIPVSIFFSLLAGKSCLVGGIFPPFVSKKIRILCFSLTR